MKKFILSALLWLSLSPALATTAIPALVTNPLTCNRTFFVGPTGTDSATCGASGTPCRTPWGADAATSIASTGTTLTGGDCVKVTGTTPTQTATSTTGTTNYDLGTGKTFTRSGTTNTATGYILYQCTINRGCKMSNSASGGTFGVAISLNAAYLAFDGMEVDGGNVNGYNGYSPSNNTAYLANFQLFGQGTAASHHHMHLNGTYHSSGGGCLGSISNGKDYEYDVAMELYDCSGNNGSHTSANNYFEFTGMTPAVGVNWDNDPFHIQQLMNVVHDVGETANITTGHTDGEAFIQDTFGATQYPYGQLYAFNFAYKTGGRGIEIFAGTTLTGTGTATVTNNTVYNNNIDLGSGNPGLDDGCSYRITWQNNLAYAVPPAIAAGWFSAPSSGCNAGVSNSTWTNNLTFNGTPGQASTSVDNGNTFVGNGNQLGVDPKITSTSPVDFHLLASSPALGAGSTLPTSRIFTLQTPDGKAPPSPPNIGAFNGPSGGGAPPFPLTLAQMGVGNTAPQVSACASGFTTIAGGFCQQALTSGTLFTSPANWNNANNTIEGIGAGGGTSAVGAFGGGGGEYCKITNFVFATPGTTTAAYVIGAGSTGNGTNTSWNGGTLLAHGGTAGTNSVGGTGGTGGTGTCNAGGSTTHITSSGQGTTGGSGAGGPNGVGGSNGDNLSPGFGGGGGGGGGGGTAGATASTGQNGGNGGNNSGGSGGGAGGTGTGAGAAGTAGGGGGGGAGNGTTSGPGGNGGPGNEWPSVAAGSGGGGGGAGGGGTNNTSNGGLYGGASGSSNLNTGTGAQGVLVVTYHP